MCDERAFVNNKSEIGKRLLAPVRLHDEKTTPALGLRRDGCFQRSICVLMLAFAFDLAGKANNVAKGKVRAKVCTSIKA
jgi:hypothetical protein